MKNNKIMPVTILTGFLGAGKTTLLNEILKKNKEANFLIIENEVGNINIDSELVNNNDKSSVFELTGGCICCSLNTELGTVLNSIILSGTKFDHVLIEATGMADTGQVINMFSGARVQRYFKLDSVIGLVDAGTFLERLPKHNEVRSQIAQSDLVLINKCDLLSKDKLKEVEEKIFSINPLAQIDKTIFGNIDDMQILNRESFNSEKVEENIVDFNQLTFIKPDNEIPHQIQTLNFNIPGNFDAQRMSVWFEDFLYLNKNNVLRIKAILSIQDITHKIILQSVGKDFHTSQGSIWSENKTKESKIVIIGTDLKEKEIRRDLNKLIV